MILDDILYNLKNIDDTYLYINSDGKYTYKEIYKYVCNLYNFLSNVTNKKQAIIVYGHKQCYMEVAFLACSFLGITYVPIDETMPEKRINDIINQINPQMIIGNFEYKGIQNINEEKIEEIISKKKYNEIQEILLKSNDIYYIIFTSGSTGKPKGVKITYSNLESCIRWLQKITCRDIKVILNQASFSFDLSISDTYLSLINGKTHYMIEDKVKEDFICLFEKLRESNADLAVMTPSFLDFLLLDKSFNEKLMPNLKQVIFCGERLKVNTVKKMQERFNNIEIINCYGPTECTFAVTSILLENPLKKEEISIGYAKEDTKIYIVDNNLNILKDNEIGEILICRKKCG